MRLFSGHAACKQLVFIVLPIISLFHAAVLAATMWANQHGTLKAYWFPKFRTVGSHQSESDGLHQRDGTTLHMLKQCVLPSFVLGGFGILLIALNLLSAKQCGEFEGNMTDPLMFATSASISQRPTLAYQYVWVLMSSITTTLILGSLRNILGSRSKKATLLYELLMSFASAHQSQYAAAIAVWRSKAVKAAKCSCARKLLRQLVKWPLLVCCLCWLCWK